MIIPSKTTFVKTTEKLANRVNINVKHIAERFKYSMLKFNDQSKLQVIQNYVATNMFEHREQKKLYKDLC